MDYSETIISEVIQVGILVQFLTSQNMRNVLIKLSKMYALAPSRSLLFQILKILSEKRASVKIVNFRSFFPGYGLFTGIKNIILNKMLYVTCSTLLDQHDKL